SDDQFRALIERGVSKINYYTALADAAGRRIADNAAAGARGYTDHLRGVREAIQAEVERCIALWGGAGQAEAVLAAAEPWEPVEHVILYNIEGLSDEEVEDMMAEGRRVLAQIPGVLRVGTGRAVREGAQYRFCWLVTFCHPAVIESYRDHPLHRRFADARFRPYADGRVSIDYRMLTDRST
ncbi:MAG: fructose-bisphosphate aldolase, partial [Gammaproteobacteria bacterium]